MQIDFKLGGAAAITLSAGQLELSNTAVPIAIDGPGASQLTIDAKQESRIFLVAPNVKASISGLTISGGSVGGTSSPNGSYSVSNEGGGIYNQGASRLPV